jgi:hypothetical protein
MSDDENNWYPTPATHQAPRLVDIPVDDPAVRALTLPPPLEPVDDDEFVSDVHIFDLANLDPSKANKKLEAAARLRADDPPSLSERLFKLELWKAKAELDIANLTALVKDLLNRSL